MSTIRQEQVQQMLVREVGSLLLRELRDPRLGFVTVTGAEISRDLRHAKVFVSVMGDETARRQSLEALASATGLIRNRFGRVARLRVTPEIEFREDTGISRGARVFELLHEVEPDLKANEGNAAKDG
ncbi:MAG TPA: 30S ribosome-binding factor RbfA [Chthonomonadales bacterium]|nr:30S ribosome-binding factor RbfA [Chthonomonadales bacterium]